MNFIEKIRQSPNAVKGYLFGDPERNGEFKFLKSILKKMPAEPIILDVGSNIGQYAIEVRRLRSDAILHCFEPAPITFQQLHDRFGRDDRITLNNSAVSSAPGQAELFIYGDVNQMNSLEKHTAIAQGALPTQVVTLTTIDQYCMDRKIDRVHFMKIDVEGHEVEVLRGAQQMIEAGNIEAIQFEYNYLWKNTTHTLQEAMLLLKQYRVFRLTPWGRMPIHRYSASLEVYPVASNYVAIRNGRQSHERD